MTRPRRATVADAVSLARLNAHVQGWHAAQYPDTFHSHPDQKALVAYFTNRLADPDCMAFLTGDPPFGYALCTVQSREASVFSPPSVVCWLTISPLPQRRGVKAMAGCCCRPPAIWRES
jgi:hypothetical protein